MASGTKVPKHVKSRPAKICRNPESESPMQTEVGTRAQFKKNAGVYGMMNGRCGAHAQFALW
jgi:hypothetical protein